MSIKIGSISAQNIYIGSTPAKEIRLGSTLIWSREPKKDYYTLTLNLEGDYEAFGHDGYTIYIDGGKFFRTSVSETYSITNGAVVSTYNNSYGTDGYEYSETITPTPSYNEDGSWIMDQDYTINVIATSANPKIIINTDDDYIDRVYIYYKLPEAEEYEWTFAQSQQTFPTGTRFYLWYSPISGCEVNWYTSTDPGSIDNPYYLDKDMTFNVYGTGSPYRYLTIDAINSITGYRIMVDRLTVKENGVTIYDETDSYGVDNLQINYGCSVTIEYDSPLFGDIEPAGHWDSFEEDTLVTISLSSN